MLPSPGLDQAGECTDGATEAQAHLDGSRWWQGAWQTVVGLQGVGGRVPGARAGLSVGRDGQGFPGLRGGVWPQEPPCLVFVGVPALRGSGGQGGIP